MVISPALEPYFWLAVGTNISWIMGAIFWAVISLPEKKKDV